MGRKKKQEDETDKDSLVGRRVEKDFQGFGKYAGSVVAYNAARGFYKVVYDDGDREELELHELELILIDVVDGTVPPSGKRGRPSKKREEPHTPPVDVPDSKRQKVESATNKQNTPSSLLKDTEDSTRITRQRVKNGDGDGAKGDLPVADECKENDDEGQLAVNEQLPSVRSSKRKRLRHDEECGSVPVTAKSSRASSQLAGSRSTRCQNLLQDFVNEVSTLDGDESSDSEAESAVDADDEVPSYDKDTLANALKEQDLPELVPLPPSSKSIPLPEDLVVDAFATHSFLRSFSHALFLSPFCLEDFVSALMAETTNHLIDSIHLILLQALRTHLQRLSKEDCFKASECLRQRDWNLLDNVTWPSFLMVFLTTHGFGKSYGRGIASMGLLDAEYYKASVKVKLAVLGFLCDQVLETEEIRAVLDARELVSTSQVRQKDMKNSSGKVTDVPETQQSLAEKEHREKVGDDTLQGTGTLSAGFLNVESKCHQEESSPDWNSDECVLCGMNGNLICCDGCPAAYHSRCVGISRASLPPGDWFCPECIVEKVGGEQSRRMDGLGGSHSLGVDPYGRLFMASCGHLLVLIPSDPTNLSYNYYNRNDISGVLQSLEVLKPHCDEVAIAIRQHWDMPSQHSSVSNSSQSISENTGPILISMEGGSNSQQHLDADGRSASVEHNDKELDTSLPEVLTSDAKESCLESESLRNLAHDYVDDKEGLVHSVAPELSAGQLIGADNVSEGAPLQRVAWDLKITPSSRGVPNVMPSGRALETISTMPLEAALINASRASGGTLSCTSKTFEGAPVVTSYSAQSQHMNGQSFEQDPYLAQKIIDRRDSKGRFLTASSREHLPPDNFQKSAPREQLYTDRFQRIGSYINHYVFGDAAATAAANLALMTADQSVISEKGLKKKTTTIAEQINAFSKAPARFCWPSYRKKFMDGPKERCGWCFSCTSCLKRGCLMNQAATQLAAGAARVAGGIRPGKSGSGHLPAVAGYLLHMEENVHSLLMGPWENMLFRKHWRKRVEQAMSICDVKAALLDLEAHLRSVVLTEDWSKCMEDAPSLVLGGPSASSLDDSLSKKASGKKISRKSGASRSGLPKSSSTALGGVQWVRRGKVAHRVSGWATLSSKVARKAGRQGGFKTVTGISYVDGEEVSKRTKQTAWRARVQAARTIAEIAVEVRCLDCVLRWDDLASKVELHSGSNVCEDAEAPKFGVHAKRIQDKVPLYLIDSILLRRPGVRHNVSVANQSQNGKDQQVWVEERQVPLSFLKEFEERERTSRQSELPKLIISQKDHPEARKVLKKDIFKFLWDRAGFSIPTKLVMSITCKYCSLKVLTSLAVQCHLCREPFHKDCTVASHSVGKLELKHTCCGCLKLAVGDKSTGIKQESTGIQKNEKAQATLNLPSHPRKIVFCQPRPQVTPPSIRLSVKSPSSASTAGSLVKEEFKKGGNQVLVRSTDSVPKNVEKNFSEGLYVYWRKNGTNSRMRFERNMLFPIEGSDDCRENPKCYSCKQQYRGDLIFIKCEYCPLWFHGAAGGVNQNNVSKVVGYKCHKCRKKAVPSCPFGTNRRTHKRVVQESIPPCTFTMGGSVEEVCITKRTPLPPFRAAENQPQQHMNSPSPSSTVAIISECATVQPSVEPVTGLSQQNSDRSPQLVEGCKPVKPLVETQPLLNGHSNLGVRSRFQGSEDESQQSLAVQSETERALQEDGQDLSGGDETILKEIVIDDSSKNGENSSQPTLSFMELLSSEDDRVEELAEVAMDFGADGFDVFDLDTLMDSFGTSALSSEPEVFLEGDPCQVLDVKSQGVIQSVGVSSDITGEICAVCCDGSLSPELQCAGCGLVVHQQCLVGQSATGGWTSHGWACDACKTGILQSQDVVADRMQLIDSRILLQS